jgi:hypothetical protein
MKKLIEVQEVQGEGLLSLMGEYVILLGINYFYNGKLVGVNDDFVLLEDGHIVYETGPWNDDKYKYAEKVADKLYVRTDAIESYAKGKKL